MRAQRVVGEIRGVTAPETDRITLELERGDPIHGTLRDPSGASHVFRGWLELCAVLDRVWQRAKDPHHQEEK
jgi:hypothetical protein